MLGGEDNPNNNGGGGDRPWRDHDDHFNNGDKNNKSNKPSEAALRALNGQVIGQSSASTAVPQSAAPSPNQNFTLGNIPSPADQGGVSVVLVNAAGTNASNVAAPVASAVIQPVITTNTSASPIIESEAQNNNAVTAGMMMPAVPLQQVTNTNTNTGGSQPVTPPSQQTGPLTPPTNTSTTTPGAAGANNATPVLNTENPNLQSTPPPPAAAGAIPPAPPVAVNTTNIVSAGVPVPPVNSNQPIVVASANINNNITAGAPLPNNTKPVVQQQSSAENFQNANMAAQQNNTIDQSSNPLVRSATVHAATQQQGSSTAASTRPGPPASVNYNSAGNIVNNAGGGQMNSNRPPQPQQQQQPQPLAVASSNNSMMQQNNNATNVVPPSSIQQQPQQNNNSTSMINNMQSNANNMQVIQNNSNIAQQSTNSQQQQQGTMPAAGTIIPQNQSHQHLQQAMQSSTNTANQHLNNNAPVNLGQLQQQQAVNNNSNMQQSAMNNNMQYPQQQQQQPANHNMQIPLNQSVQTLNQATVQQQNVQLQNSNNVVGHQVTSNASNPTLVRSTTAQSVATTQATGSTAHASGWRDVSTPNNNFVQQSNNNRVVAEDATPQSSHAQPINNNNMGNPVYNNNMMNLQDIAGQQMQAAAQNMQDLLSDNMFDGDHTTNTRGDNSRITNRPNALSSEESSRGTNRNTNNTAAVQNNTSNSNITNRKLNFGGAGRGNVPSGNSTSTNNPPPVATTSSNAPTTVASRVLSQQRQSNISRLSTASTVNQQQQQMNTSNNRSAFTPQPRGPTGRFQRVQAVEQTSTMNNNAPPSGHNSALDNSTSNYNAPTVVGSPDSVTTTTTTAMVQHHHNTSNMIPPSSSSTNVRDHREPRGLHGGNFNQEQTVIEPTLPTFGDAAAAGADGATSSAGFNLLHLQMYFEQQTAVLERLIASNATASASSNTTPVRMHNEHGGSSSSVSGPNKPNNQQHQGAPARSHTASEEGLMTRVLPAYENLGVQIDQQIATIRQLEEEVAALRAFCEEKEEHITAVREEYEAKVDNERHKWSQREREWIDEKRQIFDEKEQIRKARDDLRKALAEAKAKINELLNKEKRDQSCQTDPTTPNYGSANQQQNSTPPKNNMSSNNMGDQNNANVMQQQQQAMSMDQQNNPTSNVQQQQNMNIMQPDNASNNMNFNNQQANINVGDNQIQYVQQFGYANAQQMGLLNNNVPSHEDRISAVSSSTAATNIAQQHQQHVNPNQQMIVQQQQPMVSSDHNMHGGVTTTMDATSTSTSNVIHQAPSQQQFQHQSLDQQGSTPTMSGAEQQHQDQQAINVQSNNAPQQVVAQSGQHIIDHIEHSQDANNLSSMMYPPLSNNVGIIPSMDSNIHSPSMPLNSTTYAVAPTTSNVYSGNNYTTTGTQQNTISGVTTDHSVIQYPMSNNMTTSINNATAASSVVASPILGANSSAATSSAPHQQVNNSNLQQLTQQSALHTNINVMNNNQQQVVDQQAQMMNSQQQPMQEQPGMTFSTRNDQEETSLPGVTIEQQAAQQVINLGENNNNLSADPPSISNTVVDQHTGNSGYQQHTSFSGGPSNNTIQGLQHPSAPSSHQMAPNSNFDNSGSNNMAMPNLAPTGMPIDQQHQQGNNNYNAEPVFASIASSMDVQIPVQSETSIRVIQQQLDDDFLETRGVNPQANNNFATSENTHETLEDRQISHQRTRMLNQNPNQENSNLMSHDDGASDNSQQTNTDNVSSAGHLSRLRGQQSSLREFLGETGMFDDHNNRMQQQQNINATIPSTNATSLQTSPVLNSTSNQQQIMQMVQPAANTSNIANQQVVLQQGGINPHLSSSGAEEQIIQNSHVVQPPLNIPTNPGNNLMLPNSSDAASSAGGMSHRSNRGMTKTASDSDLTRLQREDIAGGTPGNNNFVNGTTVNNSEVDAVFGARSPEVAGVNPDCIFPSRNGKTAGYGAPSTYAEWRKFNHEQVRNQNKTGGEK